MLRRGKGSQEDKNYGNNLSQDFVLPAFLFGAFFSFFALAIFSDYSTGAGRFSSPAGIFRASRA